MPVMAKMEMTGPEEWQFFDGLRYGHQAETEALDFISDDQQTTVYVRIVAIWHDETKGGPNWLFSGFRHCLICSGVTTDEAVVPVHGSYNSNTQQGWIKDQGAPNPS
jgi:hypothetical protein